MLLLNLIFPKISIELFLTVLLFYMCIYISPPTQCLMYRHPDLWPLLSCFCFSFCWCRSNQASFSHQSVACCHVCFMIVFPAWLGLVPRFSAPPPETTAEQVSVGGRWSTRRHDCVVSDRPDSWRWRWSGRVVRGMGKVKASVSGCVLTTTTAGNINRCR